MNEYAFDCKLICAIRVKAPDEATARRMLDAEIDAAEANLGCWPNGDPIICEVSHDGHADLYEINGEPA